MAKTTRLQKDLSNLRKFLRRRMVSLARTHRNCERARGCGCIIDRAIGMLERAEQDLFALELEDAAAPSNPRRTLNGQNYSPNLDEDEAKEVTTSTADRG